MNGFLFSIRLVSSICSRMVVRVLSISAVRLRCNHAHRLDRKETYAFFSHPMPSDSSASCSYFASSAITSSVQEEYAARLAFSSALVVLHCAFWMKSLTTDPLASKTKGSLCQVHCELAVFMALASSLSRSLSIRAVSRFFRCTACLSDVSNPVQSYRLIMS